MDNWQSWSPGEKKLFKWPTRNYCPVKETWQPVEKLKDFKTAREITGWCSWYGYGRNISEKIILSEAKAIKEKKIGAEYILIDDGWCRWGEWQKPEEKKFPGGMKKIAADIRNMGFKPGLWTAPFLAKNNWGFNKKYILDFGNEEVKNYIFRCLDKILGEWKFELIKLDFLYAPYFVPGLKTNEKPTEYLREVFGYIRKKYPKVYIMTSGCPFEAAKYLVDSIRISDDVAVPTLRKFNIFKKSNKNSNK